MTIADLKNTIAELDQKIETLQDEKSTLQRMLLDKERCKYQEKFKSWNLNENSTLILFAKNPDYYKWCSIKIIRVNSIDVDNESINVVESIYRQMDYEYEYYVRKRIIRFSELEEIENNFNIYHVFTNVCDFMEHELCSLSIDYSQLSTEEDRIKSGALKFSS